MTAGDSTRELSATGTVTLATPLPRMVKQARQALSALVRELDPDAAEWVEQVRRSRPTTPSVIVVGETNRGKSSLVNALIGHAGLSPVEADVTTASHLRFEHGPEWAAQAWYPRRDPVSFGPLDPGEPTARLPMAEDGTPPRSVRIQAPLATLERITMVDTPGVGGLDSLHGELAMEAAASATALLFVVDASAPLTRGELDFLHNAGNRVETVVVALTKTDRHRGWRQVLEEDRRLLAEHAPRFADVPIHPVSARMDELAATAPSEQAGAVLRQRSGITELRSALEQLVGGRSAMLGEANTMRALSTVLGELTARLEAEQRALTTGEAEAESLRARREELTAARRSATRGSQVRLRGRIQRTRVEINHEVAKQIRDVQNWFRRVIETADRRQLAELPPHVDSALRMVSSRVAATLSDRLASVAEETLAALFSRAELDVLRARFARGAQAPVVLRPPDRRAPAAEDKLLVFMGVSGGLGVGRAAAMTGAGVAASNPIVLPVTIVLGLGAGWWMARTRKHVADKQHLKQWLTEAITEARSTLEQLVSEQLIEAEQQLALLLDEALSKRLEAIDSELREVDRALRMDAAERGEQVRTVDRRREEVRAGWQRAEQLLGSIRQLRDGTA